MPVQAHGQSAKSWAKRGADAEAHEDYDAAFEAYRQALLQRPDNLIYKTKFERVRFAAAAAHVDRGRVLRQSGDFNGALTEFQRALAIDGGNQTAQQEIVAVERDMSNAPGAALLQQAPVGPSAAASTVAGPIQLKPVDNAPVTLHVVEDTKVLYQAIAKSAGLNVIFDPDYTSRRIPLDLVNVSLYDALRILGTISGTFWKPVTSNTIFVAANTQQKRQELDTVAVQTFYISNAASAADANELLTALRNVLDPQTKIFLVPSQNAIVMRSTPDQLLLVESLLNNLDRPRSEVVVDVAVLEVNKTRTRNLGITLPQSVQLGTQLNNGTSSTLNSSSATSTSSTTTGTSTSSTTTNPSLNDLANFTASNIAVSIGTAAVNALLTDSDTRILQNPRVRATDNQKATLKIGSRIPIATGSFSSGASTAIVSSLVNTQFTYIDVGVNIEMTPTVHQDREITLKMVMEISNESGTVTISGVQQPIIGQRRVEQTIQLKEGEPSILAGLLTKDEERSVSGTPGIGSIPILNKVLGSNTKTNTDDEIVFLLIPHIVREPLITRLNTRAIDSGTSAHFELRHDDTLAAASGDTSALVTTGAFQRQQIPATGMTAAQAANAMIGQVGSEQAQRAAQSALHNQMNQPTISPSGVQQAATGPVSAQPTGGAPVRFSVVASNATQAVGSTFQVSVAAADAKDLYAAPMQVQFDPKLLSLVNVDSGEMLGRDGQAVSVVHRDEGNGMVTVSVSRPPAVRGVDGTGSVAVLTFKAIGAGDATVSLARVGAKNSAQANVPAVGSQTVVHVK
ncbi:cohesin domain-containing protein [Terriglobus aquaticus]|uniref:Cohesin domain-containing protein n=1 Tax=Terriglobus aquaticus TaxID=940139 RepID=A0ABW9KJ43_9BACT|nr:cohesin domain-containing protein [Terriglobus aquaticus]